MYLWEWFKIIFRAVFLSANLAFWGTSLSHLMSYSMWENHIVLTGSPLPDGGEGHTLLPTKSKSLFGFPLILLASPPLPHPLHAIHCGHSGHILNFCHFFVFTKHYHDGTGVQIRTLASLVWGKSHFVSAQAQLFSMHVCVCVDGNDLWWWLHLHSACTATLSLHHFKL